jgi:hypothetical protein
MRNVDFLAPDVKQSSQSLKQTLMKNSLLEQAKISYVFRMNQTCSYPWRWKNEQ